MGIPTPVPGSHTVTDKRGVTYVVFSEAPPPPPEALKRPPPAIIACLIPNDEEEEVFYHLVPVWAGDDGTTPGEVLTRPVTLFHPIFNPSTTTGPDINEATRGKIFHDLRWSEDLNGSPISVSAE